MGWTFYHREKGESNIEHFQREVVGSGGTILDGATKGGVFYAAFRPAGEEYVTALVFLTKWVRDEFNFGYKDMDEGMGPFSYDCPERILDLLSPLDEVYPEDDEQGAYDVKASARAWREKCREQIERRKSAPRVTKGTTLRFEEPYEFADGGKRDTFTLTDGRRNRWRASDGTVVRLPRDYKLRDHRVVTREEVPVDEIERERAAAGRVGSGYAEVIRRYVPDANPRHVEGYMRLGHKTLDHLGPEAFAYEARVAAQAAAEDGPESAEELARSFGL